MRRITLALALGAFAFGANATAPSELEAQCTDCTWCGGGHKAIVLGGPKASFHEICMAQSCAHPPCGVGLAEPASADELDEMKSFLYDAGQGDVVAIANIMERVGDRAVINQARGALQILGACGDFDLADAPVIVHIPLNTVQLAAAVGIKMEAALLAVGPTLKAPAVLAGGQ